MRRIAVTAALSAFVLVGFGRDTRDSHVEEAAACRYALTVGTPWRRAPLPASLSGITWAGGSTYYAVSDDVFTKEVGLYPLTLELSTNGLSVVSCSIPSPTNRLALAGAYDLEDVAFDAANGTVWAVDETRGTVKEHRISDGSVVRTLPLPGELRKTRSNLGIESLTLGAGGTALWLCTEEALTCDGPRSSPTNGTPVRLLKFTRPDDKGAFTLTGTYAYTTDAWSQPFDYDGKGRRGVSGLCALPDGSLLALEREVSITTWGRCRLYRITTGALAAATEISDLPSLTEADSYTPVAKGTRLVEIKGVILNIIVYEGIALGPILNDGSRAVYLVSDGGETKTVSILTAKTVPKICALTLTGLPDEGGPTVPPFLDWPADPDTQITDAMRPIDLGLVAGGFAEGATTTAELRRLSKWASANGVRYAALEPDLRQIVDYYNKWGKRELIGVSPHMNDVRQMAEKAAECDDPAVRVLITGPSGTGKETVAQLIHRKSKSRASGAFLTFNCACTTASLFESKLFGSVKGAFTDSRDSRGLFEAAAGGTLFLDEVAELDLDMQGQLLRVLQDGDFLKVGESVPRKIQNVRIIAATNKDIVRLVNEGRFREDLYYRLNVIQIRMKSLAERPEDIPEIAKAIWYRETGKSLSREQRNALIQYDFPGNARELENMLIYARVMKVTDFGALVEHWKRENAGLRRETHAETPPTGEALDETLDEVTARHIRQTVARHKDCPLREIAARLGCSENTVRKWLKFSPSSHE